MPQLLDAPPVGANSVRLYDQWKILMFRRGEWIPVGVCNDESLVVAHIKSLERFMPLNDFKAVLIGSENDQA